MIAYYINNLPSVEDFRKFQINHYQQLLANAKTEAGKRFARIELSKLKNVKR